MSDLDELIEVARSGDAEAQFQLADVLRQADPPEYGHAAVWYAACHNSSEPRSGALAYWRQSRIDPSAGISLTQAHAF